MRLQAAAALAILLAGAPGASSQQPLLAQPPYGTMNPLQASRSGLVTQPYAEPSPGWRVAILADYASTIELTRNGAAGLLLDSELLRLDLVVTRDLGARGFLVLGTSLQGAYDGFLDGFLNWYHDFTGLKVSGREQRPVDQFAYELDLPDGQRLVREPASLFLGDVRVGAGFRHSGHWQTVASLTLPTNTGPGGYRRGTVSASAVTTLRAGFWKRFTYEGGVGLGFTPKHGELAPFQRTWFAQATSGVRARFIGPLSLYTNVIYHSAPYHGTSLRALDTRELTIDVGGVFKFAKGPEWILGLTEDLEPRGPAIDLSFRVGARW